MAISDPRMVRASSPSSATTSRPRNITWPETRAEWGSKPRAANAVTVLPAPDSPTMPTTSFGNTSNDTPLAALTRPFCEGNCTRRLRTDNTASLAADGWTDMARTEAMSPGGVRSDRPSTHLQSLLNLSFGPMAMRLLQNLSYGQAQDWIPSTLPVRV